MEMEFAVLDWSQWSQTHSASAKTAKILQTAERYGLWTMGLNFKVLLKYTKTIKEEFPSKSSNFSGDNFELLIYLVIV